MSAELVLGNARIVLGDEVLRGAVHIRDGVIDDIVPGTGSPSARGSDLDGDFLLAGAVELHTDHLEYHFHPRPGVQWEPISAVLAHDAQLAAAGATTVLDAVRIGSAPDKSDQAAIAARQLADAVEAAADAGIVRAEHAIHLRCEVSSEDCFEAFGAFADDRHIRLASLMDHTPGQRQYADIEDFRRYVQRQRGFTPDEFDGYVRDWQDRSAQYAGGNRRAVARAAADRGITVATHDDETAAHVADAVELGARIAEFPTTATAARAAHDEGMLVVMGAPNIVRGGSQSGNVAAIELLQAGLVDILSSDYVPSSPLQAVFQLAADDLLPLHEGSKLISRNPARAIGLHDRGEIAVGRRADLVRVRPHHGQASERHPRGRVAPVVRGVLREGVRVS